MRCLTQVPVPISLVDQFGPMYVCFLPEQDMAESLTSQDARSERTSTARSSDEPPVNIDARGSKSSDATRSTQFGEV